MTNFTREAILQGVDPHLTIVMTRAQEAQQEYERASQYHSFLEAMYDRFIKGGSVKIAEALEAMYMEAVTSEVIDNQEAYFDKREANENPEEAYGLKVRIECRGEAIVNDLIVNKREAMTQVERDFRNRTGGYSMTLMEEGMRFEGGRLSFEAELWFA